MAQLPVDIPTSNILSDGNCEMSEEDDSDEEILPHIDPGPERIIESSLDGRFEKFNTVIGYGAFKVVFKGRCTTSGSEIAWCERRSRGTANFQHEATLLQRLCHPNVLQAYGLCRYKDDAVLILEHVTGGDLKRYMDTYHHKDGVSLELTKTWGRQMLEGLQCLHSQEPKIVHRDMKCRNVLLSAPSGTLKICDFGIAEELPVNNPFINMIAGTVAFRAPEMYQGAYNELVDVYAFGMCLLEMALLELPFSECKFDGQIVRKLANGILPKGIERIANPVIRKIVQDCSKPFDNGRLSAAQLLEDGFFAMK